MIKFDKRLTLALYKLGEMDTIIPSDYWKYTVNIFAKILKKDKDKKFSNKIKFG
ncbi:hypothetical protein AGMMS49944_22130 [Spirochaetia bacterium]|nr:hypothetical protein AGMMS49944_22130 [Spirochaetia bacterium]